MKSQIPGTKSQGFRCQVSGKKDIEAEILFIVICVFYSSNTPSLHYFNTPILQHSSAVSAISAVKDKKPLAVHPTSGLAFPRAACVVALIRGDHDTNCNTYRCFLPDLTGFVSVCCAVSDQHQPQTGPGPTNTLHGGFNPA